MEFVTKISDILNRLFYRLRRRKREKEYVKIDEMSNKETQTKAKEGLVNTLKVKKKKLSEQRQNIHQKIKSIEKKYKEGKISIDERDEQILKLLKKGVKLRKEIERIAKEIHKLETYSYS